MYRSISNRRYLSFDLRKAYRTNKELLSRKHLQAQMRPHSTIAQTPQRQMVEQSETIESRRDKRRKKLRKRKCVRTQQSRKPLSGRWLSKAKPSRAGEIKDARNDASANASGLTIGTTPSAANG
jgi:hypothetical protein